MDDNLIKYNWESTSKGLNLVINDNKKISKMFGDRYLQFLHLNKGTQINSKTDMINMLNRKPRSLLTAVQLLVKKFKTYQNILINYHTINKVHPKNFILLNKNIVNPISNNLLDEALPKSFLKIISSELKNPIHLESLNKSDLITAKIYQLKKALNNNKLPIPFEFLNPLLKLNKENKENNYNYKLDNLDNLDKSKLVTKNGSILPTAFPAAFQGSTKFIDSKVISPQSLPLKNPLSKIHKIRSKGVHNVSFRLKKIINKSKISLFKNILKYGIKTPYTDQINKFRNLIQNYQQNINQNNIINTNIIKYFKVVTPYKVVNPFHQNIRYNFSKYNKINIDNIVTLLEYAFRAMSCLISKPIFLITSNKIVINLFYYFIPGQVNKKNRRNRLNRLDLFKKDFFKDFKNLETNIATEIDGIAIFNNKNNNQTKNKNKTKKKELSPRAKEKLLFKKYSLQFLFTPKNQIRLNKLCTILSRIFNKPVVLDLIPLRLPFFDDNILVKALGMMCNLIPVRTFFNFIFRRTILYSKIQANYKYRYSVTRSFLSGIKIKIGGRLMTQKVIPRISSRVLQRGAISQSKVTYVDWSRVNLKNRRGAHSITVTMSHII